MELLLEFVKRQEVIMHNIRAWYYKRQGFSYDGAKRMWFKTRSECCNATVHGVTMLDGRPISKPFTSYPEKQRKNIYFRDWCDNCHRQCKTITETRT